MRSIVLVLAIGIGVLAVIGVVRLTQFSRKALAQDRAMVSAFVADPANRTSVSVRGWSGGELHQILSDFRRAYDLPQHSDWTVTDTPNGDHLITFPSDIQPKLLFFLVNYIQYPKNFDLTQRSIGVLCHTTLTSAFGVPDASLVGKKAMIYVPANDTEYDLVYAKVDSAEVYRIPFTTLIWETTGDARIPNSINGL